MIIYSYRHAAKCQCSFHNGIVQSFLFRQSPVLVGWAAVVAEFAALLAEVTAVGLATVIVIIISVRPATPYTENELA